MTQQKEAPKGRVKPVKYCIDCRYATTNETGSLIWISCKFQDGWRSVSSECNLPIQERSP